MGRLIEGLWDCAYCGTKGIGGSKQYCTNCGRTRTKDTTFYMPGQKRYVPEEEARKINRNPDWVCEYCDNLNPDGVSKCLGCGAERDAQTLNYFQNKAKREAQQEVDEKRTEYHRIDESEYEDVRYKEPEPSVRKQVSYQESEYGFKNEEITTRERKLNSVVSSLSSVDWTPILCGVLIVALLVGLVFLFMPKEMEITITNMSWERNIDVEEYRTVNESAWDLPAGGRLQYTNREIHHYEKVLDHYETKYREVAKQRFVRTETYVTGYRDLGNGYMEEQTATRDIYETYYETESYQEPVYRDEPVYRTKYYYEIERWVYDRTITSQASNKDPKWPLVEMADNEREGTRKETYTVTGKDDEEEIYTFTLSYSDWERVNVGQAIKVEVSFGHGEIISVDENFVVYEAG